MSNKLHELLAVEGDLKDVSNKITREGLHTFKEKPNHFISTVRRVEMFDEGAPAEADQYQAMVTTVQEKLDYCLNSIGQYYDAVFQKEKGNQAAVADIIVEGTTLATNVPATFLLGMEAKLSELRNLYMSLPTLAPGIEWEEDPSKGEGVYRTKYPDEKFKTAKTVKSKVLYEATKEHPAQIDKWNEDEKVGKIITTAWSSMLSPAGKSKLLGRIDKLLQAVKKARQRANNTEVSKETISKTLFDFIHAE